ncbi:substrate binding domain-containing protein, partial [Roseovarius indicus]
HGAPADPSDLARHDCILDTNRRTPRRWTFYRQGEEIGAEVKGRFQVNSARAAVELAADGLGICYTPRFALNDELETGALVPVLQDFQGLAVEINAVYLEGRALPRKIRALIDFAVEDIRLSGTL